MPTFIQKLFLILGLLLALYPNQPIAAQTTDQLKRAIAERVESGDYPEAFQYIDWLIPQLQDPAEITEYQQYREQLLAYYNSLSELERWQLKMVSAGRELAAMHLGGESRYLAAIQGGIPIDNTDLLVNTCEQELEKRMGIPHPLRMTSKPWVIAIDTGIYNISGVISGPEWGELTVRWRYHCLVRHDAQGIHTLIVNSWK